MYCGQWQVETTTDRSVQGSMRAAGTDLKFFCDEHDLMKTPHAKIQQWLNNWPVSVKGRKDYHWPDKEMKAIVEQLILSGR
ncbi:MAG: DUF6933 domain-containing protein [Endozoicomonas sp.]